MRIGLPSGPRASRPAASAYLRPSWKMWPISMPRSIDRSLPQTGAGVAGRISAALDRAVGDEVAARDHVGGVLAGLVGAGHPLAAVDHAGVDQVADAELLEDLRADVAADEAGVPGEVGRLEDGRLAGGQRGLQALEVDLAVAGHADDQGLGLFRAGRDDLDDHVLEGVGGGDVQAVVLVHVGDERVDRGGVGGVEDLQGLALAGERRGGRGRHGLGVGGVAAGAAGHEGVLAGGGGGEELLGGRAAHRAGGGEADLHVDAEPLEDADVGGAVVLVAALEALVVEVEGVGVLHHELAAAQDAGAGTKASSRYLVWIW